MEIVAGLATGFSAKRVGLCTRKSATRARLDQLPRDPDAHRDDRRGAVVRNIPQKKERSRFRKAGRGLFALRRAAR